MKRWAVFAAVVVTAMLVIPGALAQGVDGGCQATVNGRTLDTLDAKHPLVVAEGDTVALTGAIPSGANDGSSETRIVVEVVGDIPVATEPGNGAFWGGSVDVPAVLTQLAPGVYKVKGTATGSGWVCNGSAYVKIEGGPVSAAAAVGAVAAVAGGIGAISAARPKRTQVFTDNGAAPEASTRMAADAITFLLFLALIMLTGFLAPSWLV